MAWKKRLKVIQVFEPHCPYGRPEEDFGLAQPWPLGSSGDRTSKWKISLSGSLSEFQITTFFNNFDLIKYYSGSTVRHEV